MQTFTAMQYLQADISGHFGNDKMNWEPRINWTVENEDHLEKLLDKADNPALYYAAVQAYRAAQKGEPIGFPISLDAASSGLQLLAIFVGCEASAKLCGVVSTGHREDAYTVIYQAMCEAIGDTARIQRKDTKLAIMTSLYNSTAVPKKIFGEGKLLDIFHETMETEAPGAWELKNAFEGLWQPYALSHDWVLPDNFHVHVPVMTPINKTFHFLNQPMTATVKENLGTKEGRSLGPNITHSVDGMIVREIHARCDYDPDMLSKLIELVLYTIGGTREDRDQDKLVATLWRHYELSGFLSARILSYLDRQNLGLVDKNVIMKLIKTLPEKPFQVMSIHDCFRVHPNYGNDIRRQYNQILSDLAASDILSYIVSQIVGRYVPVNKRGDISKKILEADYTLC